MRDIFEDFPLTCTIGGLGHAPLTKGKVTHSWQRKGGHWKLPQEMRDTTQRNVIQPFSAGVHIKVICKCGESPDTDWE